ncbi:HYC_CC_PP family protein [Pontibacter amylolyticus]|uniref:DUF2946 domain-containing protein n=1 Tax=Pontibacter amylolyticus TaxID=1424080 RepID=A0ABQ1VYT2_9BACT|nr:hypothetical protein [Pontibacter amylolyticus]GGG06259.1 hypothetical protein GCM10011323_08720 [Pontibacter amylolyticus]
MNQTIRHTVLLLLTLSILLGSFGVALSEQLCLMTGLKMTAAQGQDGSCCQKPGMQEHKEQQSNEDDCCTTALSFEKLEPVSSLKGFALELPVFFAVTFTPLFATWAPAVATDQRILTYSDSSPPLYGRQLLHSLHILIV